MISTQNVNEYVKSLEKLKFTYSSSNYYMEKIEVLKVVDDPNKYIVRGRLRCEEDWRFIRYIGFSWWDSNYNPIEMPTVKKAIDEVKIKLVSSVKEYFKACDITRGIK